MEKPKSPQKSPYKVKVEKGKIYFWCACGLSNKLPFCDGAHYIEGKFKSLSIFSAQLVIFSNSLLHSFCSTILTNSTL